MNTPFDTVRNNAELINRYSEPGDTRDRSAAILATLVEIERTHYTAEDVADASAKGFRDGVASVTAGQELVAKLHSDGHWTPIRSAAGRALNFQLMFAGAPAVEVYTAAPVAQQQQAEAVPPTHVLVPVELCDAVKGWLQPKGDSMAACKRLVQVGEAWLAAAAQGQQPCQT